MYKWFAVRLNGGETAVLARSAEDAMEIHAAYSGLLSILPGTTASEITADEAEEYYYRIR